MSDIGRFVSFIVPDVAEAGAKIWGDQPSDETDPKPPGSPRSQATGLHVRKPRQPGAGPSTLGKMEYSVNVTNPRPGEIQAGLDATLAKFVDDQPDPIRRAEVLIKIGQYQVELSKYAPMLRDADTETATEALRTWFDAGDGAIKAALVNSASGSEAFVLQKSAPATEGPDFDLARMLDAVPAGNARAGLLQKMAFYGAQLNEMTGRGVLLKIDPDVIDASVADWIEAGDGSHRALKKALADVDRMARHEAMTHIGEDEACDEMAGNAATHAASKLSGQNERSYGRRSTGEGAGPHMRGSSAPGTANDDDPASSSGPNDTGEGELHVEATIRRKGSTGGHGTVTPEEHAVSEANDNARGGKKKPKKPAMDKNGDLAVELVKIAPEAMVAALSELDADDQVEVCQLAAADAADLMAWSVQTGDRLQKSALDGAVADWLLGDPDTFQLKKWVAEALATAEEIPLALAKAIMAFEPPAPVQVRRPYGTAA